MDFRRDQQVKDSHVRIVRNIAGLPLSPTLNVLMSTPSVVTKKLKESARPTEFCRTAYPKKTMFYLSSESTTRAGPHPGPPGSTPGLDHWQYARIQTINAIHQANSRPWLSRRVVTKVR